MKELDSRKAIWKSISEFYLDTELQDADYHRIAQNLKKSGLSIKKLKEIDLYEVFPSLQKNLNKVAGEWTGFNEDWLMLECTKNFRRKENKLFQFIIKMRSKSAYWMRKKHWERIEVLMS